MFVSEVDKYAKEVYVSNFNEINFEDIFDIYDFEKNDVCEKLNIIFCGFPCQSFSSAGNRKGFDDESRGKMIFKIIEIVKKKNPEIVLLENVKHLVKHNNNKTFEIIKKSFTDLGYITTKEPLILSPFKDFKIAQNRERVFIPFVSKKITNDSWIEQDFSIQKNKYHMDFIVDKKADKNLYIKKDEELNLALIAWKEFVEYFTKKNIKIPVIWLEEMCKENYHTKSKATDKKWFQQYMNSMKKFYEENKQFIDKWIKKHKPFEWKLRRNKKLEWQAGNTKFDSAYLQPRQSGLRFRKNACFPTLVATVQIPLIKDKKGWRKLSPKEVSRLQSFPENHKICKNTFQAYKQYGNSINVKTAEWVIAAYLGKYLEKLYE